MPLLLERVLWMGRRGRVFLHDGLRTGFRGSFALRRAQDGAAHRAPPSTRFRTCFENLRMAVGLRRGEGIGLEGLEEVEDDSPELDRALAVDAVAGVT